MPEVERVRAGPLRRLGQVARWVAAPALLVVACWRVDVRAVGGHLTRLDPRFAVAFLAVSVLFYLLCAWRWSFTARRLGVTLPLGRAFLDYYLSTLLNQVLPVGIAGDVVRATRHRRRLGAGWGPAVKAVTLERLSGLLGLTTIVVVSALAWFARGERRFVLVAAVLGLVAAAVAVAGRLFAARSARFPRLAGLAVDARSALVADGALPIQLAASVAAVVLLLVMFACAGGAVGVPIDVAAALRIGPILLAVTTLPWAFAGWGARELSAAALFGLAGLDPAAGVAVSVAFGVLSLLAATPGLLVLLLPDRSARRGGDPDQGRA